MAGRNLFAEDAQPKKGRNLFANDGSVGPTVQNANLDALSKLTQNPVVEMRMEDFPMWQRPLVAADDLARKFAGGASFGYADKLASALNGTPLEQERRLTEIASNRAGSAGTAAELGGAVAAPLALGGAGLTLGGRLGTAGMSGVEGALARTAILAPEAAGYGALTAAGNDQNIKTGALLGLAGGTAGNLAGEAVGPLISKVAGLGQKKPSIPTADDIDALKKAAYKRAEDAGVIYTPQAVDRLKQKVVDAYTDVGYLPSEQTGARAVLKEINKLQGQNVTFTGLDAIRKQAGGAFQPMNKTNNKLVNEAKRAIDDLIDNPRPSDFLGGDTAATSAAAKEARDYAQRQFKLNDVEAAVQRAKRVSSGEGSGSNIENRTRQYIGKLQDKRGLSPDELAAIQKTNQGSLVHNALRLGGKLAPTGIVSTAGSLGTGYGVGGPVGAIAAPIVGMSSKLISDALTKKNVNQLVKVIAAGGDASATRAAPNALQRLTQSKRDAIARALMALGVNLGATQAPVQQ